MTDPSLVPRRSSVASPRRTNLRSIFNHPLTHLTFALLIIGLLQGFVVKQFAVPSGSMEQTLNVGDRLIVNRLAYAPGKQIPAHADVVVFHTDETLWPSQSGFTEDTLLNSLKFMVKRVFGDYLGFGPTTQNHLVKRVIGTPGQTIECCNSSGAIVLDGQSINEPYIFQDLPFVPGKLDCQTQPQSQRCFPPVTVPEDRLLLMGDHRSNSSDGISNCRGSLEVTGEECVRWAKSDDVVGKVHSIIWPLNRFGAVKDD